MYLEVYRMIKKANSLDCGGQIEESNRLYSKVDEIISFLKNVNSLNISSVLKSRIAESSSRYHFEKKANVLGLHNFEIYQKQPLKGSRFNINPAMAYAEHAKKGGHKALVDRYGYQIECLRNRANGVSIMDKDVFSKLGDDIDNPHSSIASISEIEAIAILDNLKIPQDQGGDVFPKDKGRMERFVGMPFKDFVELNYKYIHPEASVSNPIIDNLPNEEGGEDIMLDQISSRNVGIQMTSSRKKSNSSGGYIDQSKAEDKFYRLKKHFDKRLETFKKEGKYPALDDIYESSSNGIVDYDSFTYSLNNWYSSIASRSYEVDYRADMLKEQLGHDPALLSVLNGQTGNYNSLRDSIKDIENSQLGEDIPSGDIESATKKYMVENWNFKESKHMPFKIKDQDIKPWYTPSYMKTELSDKAFREMARSDDPELNSIYKHCLPLTPSADPKKDNETFTSSQEAKYHECLSIFRQDVSSNGLLLKFYEQMLKKGQKPRESLVNKLRNRIDKMGGEIDYSDPEIKDLCGKMFPDLEIKYNKKTGELALFKYSANTQGANAERKKKAIKDVAKMMNFDKQADVKIDSLERQLASHGLSADELGKIRSEIQQLRDDKMIRGVHSLKTQVVDTLYNIRTKMDNKIQMDDDGSLNLQGMGSDGSDYTNNLTEVSNSMGGMVYDVLKRDGTDDITRVSEFEKDKANIKSMFGTEEYDEYISQLKYDMESSGRLKITPQSAYLLGVLDHAVSPRDYKDILNFLMSVDEDFTTIDHTADIDAEIEKDDDLTNIQAGYMLHTMGSSKRELTSIKGLNFGSVSKKDFNKKLLKSLLVDRGVDNDEYDENASSEDEKQRNKEGGWYATRPDSVMMNKIDGWQNNYFDENDLNYSSCASSKEAYRDYSEGLQSHPDVKVEALKEILSDSEFDQYLQHEYANMSIEEYREISKYTSKQGSKTKITKGSKEGKNTTSARLNCFLQFGCGLPKNSTVFFSLEGNLDASWNVYPSLVSYFYPKYLEAKNLKTKVGMEEIFGDKRDKKGDSGASYLTSSEAEPRIGNIKVADTVGFALSLIDENFRRNIGVKNGLGNTYEGLHDDTNYAYQVMRSKDVLDSLAVGSIDGQYCARKLSHYIHRERPIERGEHGFYIGGGIPKAKDPSDNVGYVPGVDVGYVTNEQYEALKDVLFGRAMPGDNKILGDINKNDSLYRKFKRVIKKIGDPSKNNKTEDENIEFKDAVVYNSSAESFGLGGLDKQKKSKLKHRTDKIQLDNLFHRGQISDQEYSLKSEMNDLEYTAIKAYRSSYFNYNRDSLNEIKDLSEAKYLDFISASNGDFDKRFTLTDFSNVGSAFNDYKKELASKYSEVEDGNPISVMMNNFTKRASETNPDNIVNGEAITREFPLDNYSNGKFSLTKEDVGDDQGIAEVGVNPNKNPQQTDGADFVESVDEERAVMVEDIKDQNSVVDDKVNPLTDDNALPVGITPDIQSNPSVGDDDMKEAEFIKSILDMNNGKIRVFDQGGIDHMRDVQYAIEGSAIKGLPEWYDPNAIEAPGYESTYQYIKAIGKMLSLNNNSIEIFDEDRVASLIGKGYKIDKTGNVIMPDWYTNRGESSDNISEETVDKDTVETSNVIGEDKIEEANYVSNILSNSGGKLYSFDQGGIDHMKDVQYTMDGQYISAMPSWYIHGGEEAAGYESTYAYAKYVYDLLSSNGGHIAYMDSSKADRLKADGYSFKSDGTVIMPEWFQTQKQASSFAFKSVFSEFEIDNILKRYGV
jgi:hypothetical protein